MCEYTIEEPDEIISKYQKKRFRKVINQMTDVWKDTTIQIKFIHDVDIDICNNIMNKLHKVFFIIYKNKIEYYCESNIELRKKKNYMSRKINKLKNNKYKL